MAIWVSEGVAGTQRRVEGRLKGTRIADKVAAGTRGRLETCRIPTIERGGAYLSMGDIDEGMSMNNYLFPPWHKPYIRKKTNKMMLQA